MPDESYVCDESTAFAEEESHGKDNIIRLLQDVPQAAISILSNLLRPDGRGNWKYLAAELNFSTEAVTHLESQKDPVNALFKKWKIENGSEATVQKLLDALQKIRRPDCISDIKNYIVENQMCGQDGLQQQEREQYDIFISYAEDDIQFAQFLLVELEKKNYKVCIDYRDLLLGNNIFDESGDIIENRCRKVIVILSEAFNNCEINDFQAKLALSRSPSGRKRILIPVMYQRCTVPSVLRIFHYIDYSQLEYRKYFWHKLLRSLGQPMFSAES